MAYIFITTKGKTNWKYILIIVILALIVIGETLYLLKQEEKIPEIKLPEKVVKDETLNWKTYRNEEYGFEFKYPEGLGKKYINAHKWPPEITVKPIGLHFNCEEVQEFNLPGLSSKKEITFNHSNYCIVTGSEGAAGSTYVTYKYITNKDNKQLTIEFILRFTNCGVFYGINNKMEECQKEIKDFKDFDTVTSLIDKMLSTFRFLK